jgi:hypothetical protein
MSHIVSHVDIAIAYVAVAVIRTRSVAIAVAITVAVAVPFKRITVPCRGIRDGAEDRVDKAAILEEVYSVGTSSDVVITIGLPSRVLVAVLVAILRICQNVFFGCRSGVINVRLHHCRGAC